VRGSICAPAWRASKIFLWGTILLAACSESPLRSDTKLDGRRTDIYVPWPFPEAGPDSAPPDLYASSTDKCTGAKSITLSSTAVTVTGTTSSAKNEFSSDIRCGEVQGLSGPQRYYRFDLVAGEAYTFTVTPQFGGVFYVFSECAKNLINVDCGSEGATGLFSGAIASGESASETFVAPASGTYYLAVDSASSTEAGSFELTAVEVAAPANASCSSATALALSSGKASVTGTTVGAQNEFQKQVGCGLGVDFDGPQVYYTVSMTAKTWYKLSLTADHSASLYLAGAAGGCKAANIETDCSGLTGTVIPEVQKGATEATAFSPLTSASQLLAVDSLDPKSSGSFTLAVEELSGPGNMVCAGAKKLTLSSSGTVTASGDTSSQLNDLGAFVACGSAPPLLGPQSYYSVDLEKKTYILSLVPSFDAVLAVASSCTTLPTDCSSAGSTGAALIVKSGATGTLTYSPTSAATTLLVVDSSSSQQKGAFQLTVAEHTTPKNGVCASPTRLTLATSPTVELGTTGPLTNDLSGVTCGLSGSFAGPQAYYLVTLVGGSTYTLDLAPESAFDAAIYALPATTSCTATAVSSACTGLASDSVGDGVKESLTIAPTTDTDYLIVVDSWSASEAGSYTLTVSWK
jgi:hypothetical protein